MRTSIDPQFRMIAVFQGQMMDCRKCGSPSIRRSTLWGYVPLLWILFPLARCRDCGKLFRVPFWVPMPERSSKSDEFDSRNLKKSSYDVKTPRRK